MRELEQKLYLYVFFCISISLFFISAFRGGGDPDYNNYINIYNESIKDIVINIEPFYLILNKTFNNIDLPFKALIFFISFIAIGLKCFIIYKESRYKYFSLIIYISTIYIMFDLIAIRQGVAIAFVLLSIIIYKESKTCSLIFVLIGSLFHSSALIFIPVLYFSDFNVNNKFIYGLLLVVIIINIFKIALPIQYLSHLPLLPDFLINKFEIYSSYKDVSFLSLKQLIVCVVAAFVYIKMEPDKLIKQMCLIYLIGAFISILLSSVGDISFRIRWYFFFTEIFFIPFFICNIKQFFTRDDFINVIFLKLFPFAFISILYIVPAINFIASIKNRGSSLIF